MRCGLRDCVHFYQGHLACLECWRSQGLRDHYQTKGGSGEYQVKGKIVNLLGEAWVVYCQSGLTKHYAAQILLYVQRAQELVMAEVLAENDDSESRTPESFSG